MAPKPALAPLTGGYRRIPVLQIGADIYCDTRRILAELERRCPTPTLYPAATRGRADMIAGWADQALFATALGLVFGIHGDRFPPELHADRAAFTAGRFDGWDSARMRPLVPSLRDQFSQQLAWIDAVLADAGAFLLGAAPSLADLAIYHPLWYVRGNLGEQEGLFKHPRVLAWMEGMASIGHGTMQPMTPEEALSVAQRCEPLAFDAVEVGEWEVGAPLVVTPTDWGFDGVQGAFEGAERDSIAIRRSNPLVGEVIVHFPRSGFAIARR